MNTIQKNLIIGSRIFVGIIFIYSGFVKGIDPLGSAYKFNDYFTAFNTSWASQFSLFLSILQSIAEFVVGVGILLNLKIKQSSWGALLFMLIFTPITFILALNNPVHDCGCFGDALILTNWQTFWKNIILLVPVVYILINRKKIENNLLCWEQWIAIGVITLLMGILIGNSYQHLPLLDFRPYKVGTHIPEKMSIPEGAAIDEWESIFIYSKNGKELEFTVNNLPDSTWKFVDAKHILIKKGYEPPIHDFNITTAEGDEITDLVLKDKNYTFLLITHNINEYSFKNQERIEKLVGFCNKNGYNFYGVTSSSSGDINNYFERTNAIFEFYNADDITLKTIIRSNPGLVLIKSGTILDKWHNNDIPEIEELKNDLTAITISKYKKSSDNYYILLLIITGGLMISLYLLIRKLVSK